MEREWETVKGETAKGKTAKGENLFIFRNSEWMGKQDKGEFIGETDWGFHEETEKGNSEGKP